MKKWIAMIYIGMGLLSGAFCIEFGNLLPLPIGYGMLLMLHGVIVIIDRASY